MQEYRVKPNDLGKLRRFELANPHYKIAPPMQLYLHRHVRDLARRKYGNDEPYLVTLVPFPESLLRWFSEDPERLREMSPNAFQKLTGDRLDAMGLEVRIVGHVNRKDGCIDLVAYPKEDRCHFPFLIAVQTKHHTRLNVNTEIGDVREFHGAVSSRGLPFHVGLIVTNTGFTPDALWFARHNAAILRLRDLEDLRRWLHSDFDNDFEWREIPPSIELAPGVKIVIPRPRLIVPSADC
jgi:hypothetical protein